MQAKLGDKHHKVETMESVSLNPQHTTMIKDGGTTPQTIEHGRHTPMTTSDVMWSVGPMPSSMRSLINLRDASELCKISFAKTQIYDDQSSQGCILLRFDFHFHLPLIWEPNLQTRIVSSVLRDVTQQAYFGGSTGSSFSSTPFSSDNRQGSHIKQFNDYFANEWDSMGRNGAFLDAKGEVAASPVLVDFQRWNSVWNIRQRRRNIHPTRCLTSHLLMRCRRQSRRAQEFSTPQCTYIQVCVLQKLSDEVWTTCRI